MKIIDNSGFFFSTIFIITISMIINTVHSNQPKYSNSISTSTILNPKYQECKKKQKCGDIDLIYPFFSSDRPTYCGYPGFELIDCESAMGPHIIMKTHTYTVMKINSSESTTTLSSDGNAITIIGSTDHACAESFVNATIDFTRFDYTSKDQNITFFYHCDDQYPLPKPLPHNLTVYSCTNDSSIVGYYLTKKLESEYGLQNLLTKCRSQFFFPALINDIKRIDESLSIDDLLNANSNGFELRWNADNDKCLDCLKSGCLCGSSDVDSDGSNKSSFLCHCADKSYPKPGPGSNSQKRILIGKVATIVAVTTIAVVLIHG